MNVYSLREVSLTQSRHLQAHAGQEVIHIQHTVQSAEVSDHHQAETGAVKMARTETPAVIQIECWEPICLAMASKPNVRILCPTTAVNTASKALGLCGPRAKNTLTGQML